MYQNYKNELYRLDLEPLKEIKQTTLIDQLNK